MIIEQKNKILKEELNSIKKKHERINTLGTILSQPITYDKGNSKIKQPNDFYST